MASDLSVSVTMAGQLVTVFALTYAISSPLLTALTGGLDRRRLLILSMVGFAGANVMACTATGYWGLMGARILLAMTAGLYVPNANALAGTIVAPARRGKALAVVNGGTTMAVVLGVPLGAMLGNALGWRVTFASVFALACIAAGGLMIGLPRRVGATVPIAGLRERIAVVRDPAVLLGLLVTMLWALGAYTIYTYLTTFLSAATMIEGAHVSGVLFLWGAAAAAGLYAGGALSDRLGALRVIVPCLVLLALVFAGLSASARLLTRSAALLPVLGAVTAWGLAAWAFFPAQQSRLIMLAGTRAASVVLSLNASFMYLGFSLGAGLGSLTLRYGAPADLGWVGGLCEAAAVVLLLGIGRFAVAASGIRRP
jgi:predicted MFS family arabinose efflux permease